MASTSMNGISHFHKLNNNKQWWTSSGQLRSTRKQQQQQHLHLVSRSCIPTNNNNDSDFIEAARYTVDTYIQSGMVVGLGSGVASAAVIKYMGQKIKEGKLRNVVGIPMSAASASEGAKAGIPLEDFKDVPKTDFAFDDADTIEHGSVAAVIGRWRPSEHESLIQEKTILKATDDLTFIIDDHNYHVKFESSIPVLVSTDNWMEIADEIEDLFLGDVEVWRRPNFGEPGPLGGYFPLVTREGHNVLDVIFTTPISDLVRVAESLERIDGVIDHGVIYGIKCRALIVSNDGLKIVDNLRKNVITT